MARVARGRSEDHRRAPAISARTFLRDPARSVPMNSLDATRREFLGAAVVTGATVVGGHLMPGTAPPAAAQQVPAPPPPLDVALRVNGAEHRLTLDARTT